MKYVQKTCTPLFLVNHLSREWSPRIRIPALHPLASDLSGDFVFRYNSNASDGSRCYWCGIVVQLYTDNCLLYSSRALKLFIDPI